MKRSPEAQCSVADRDLRIDVEFARSKAREKLVPTLPTLAIAALDREALLAAVAGGTDHDEDALAIFLEDLIA